MARRPGLAPEIRARLPILAKAGIGLDQDAPTVTADGIVLTAAECLRHEPSPQMRAKANEVAQWLVASGARHVVIDSDPRAQNEPGSLVVSWLGDINPVTVATQFATSHTEEGLPRVPAWLKLRSESTFDMRYQRMY